MADQLEKVEGQIELKSDADKFFKHWTQDTHLVAESCPHWYPKIELHEGDSWHSAGSIKTWHYVAHGRQEFVKTKVEEIDEGSRTVHYSYIDGTLLKNYFKIFKSKVQVTPNGEGCTVKWTFEFEKMNEDAPDTANIYIHVLLGVAKDIDARLCGTKLEKVEGQIDLKSDADKFFKHWTQDTHLVAESCPHWYPKIELHEGDSWHSAGAVKTWHYIAHGNQEFVKTKVEKIDEGSRTVYYSYIDGTLLKNYFKIFKSKVQVTPNGEGCLVKWTFEFEKKTEDAPDTANIYIHVLLGVAKDIDDRLCSTTA